MKKNISIKLIASLTLISAFNAQAKSNHNDVIQNFANISSAMIEDSVITGKTLQGSIAEFLASPSQDTLAKAKSDYRLARVPYQQFEILRFDAENGHVTEGLEADGGLNSVDDWEGQVNAWPLDEALIDYVDAGVYEGEYAESVNIINATEPLSIGSDSVDVSEINADLLISLNEFGGSEANVATGIHAIEFLLWGQDLFGTEAGAGQRPVSDYYTSESQGKCTSGSIEHNDYTICQRRSQFLNAVSELYVADLTAMNNEWSKEANQQEGTLSYDFINNGKGVNRIVDSIGDMSAGELASERMKVAVLFGSTEDEHDCFSDNTHVAIENNARGIINAFRGEYTRVNGDVIKGASIFDLINEKDEGLANSLNDKLSLVETQMKAISALADDDANPVKFDQIVGGTQEQKDLVLNASASLVEFADELGNNLSNVVNLQLNEFDKGTCTGNTVDDCDS